MKRIMVYAFLFSIFLSSCTSIENKQPVLYEFKPVKEQVSTQALVSYNNEFLALENGKVGIIDRNGEILIHPSYHAIYTTASGEYLGKKDDGYDVLRDHHVVDEFQTTMRILEEKYDSYLYETLIGLWRVRKDGRRAYVDMSGKQLSTTMYERISPITLPGDGSPTVASNMFASYEKRNNQYYCAIHSMDGNEIIPPITLAQEYEDALYCIIYTYSADWTASLNNRVPVDAIILEDNQTFDAYLVNGTKLIDDADRAEFVWDTDTIEYEKDGNLYVIDFDGVIVQKQKEITIDQYIIKQKNDYFGVESVDGDVILPYRYDSIEPVIYANDTYKDFFQVKRDGKQFVVDVDGNEVFEYHSFGIQNTRNPHLWIANDEHWDYQLLNEKGEVLIDEWFDYFEVGYFVIAYTAEGYRVYDQNASLIYESEQYYPSSFLGDLPYFLVKENEKIIIKDASGTDLGNYLYHRNDALFYEKKGILYAKSGDIQLVLDEFDSSNIIFANIQGIDGLFLKHGNKIHFFDEQLNSYYDKEIDSIDYAGSVLFEDYGLCQYFAVEKDGKFALMLESGELITDFAYDELKFVNSYGFIAVRNDDRWGVMNYRGELVVDYIYNAETLEKDIPRDGVYANPYSFLGEWYQTYLPEYDVIYVRGK